MSARRRYRGPVRLTGYFCGGPYDGCVVGDVRAMISGDGAVRVEPPTSEDSAVLTAVGHCHVYRPSTSPLRWMYDGWELVERDDDAEPG